MVGSSRSEFLKTVGAYALMEKFSDGYLGPVYKSFDKEKDRAVEVRIFCDGIQWDEDLKCQMVKECAPLMHLEHPHIASLIALHTEGRIPFMVMEPVGKRNLRNVLDRKPAMSFESKISIMMQAAQALAFAHEKGITHQDICPENIFIRVDGSVRIRDFAVARFLRKHLPHPGVRYGEPIYLSPEQIRHQEASARSDVFAAGVVFYELLTGSHPFFDPDSNKMLDNILNHRPQGSFGPYPNFHPRIWHIMKKCLAKRQEDRYRDGGEMLAAFQSMFKEMTEDVHLMLSELQASFASLKAVSERAGASKESCRLSRNIWNILRGLESPDYERLDALMTDLCEIFPEIQAGALDGSIKDDDRLPRIRPEDLHAMSDRPVAIGGKGPEAALPQSCVEGDAEKGGPDTSLRSSSSVGDIHREATTRHEAAPAEQAWENSAGNGRSDRTLSAAVPEPQQGAFSGTKEKEERPNAESSPADRKIRDITAERREPHPAPSGHQAETGHPGRKERPAAGKPSGRRRTFRFSKSSLRIFAALILVLIIVATAHVLRKEGHEGTLFGSWTNRVQGSRAPAKGLVLKDATAENAGSDTGAQVTFSTDDSKADYESLLLDSLEVGYPDGARPHALGEKLDRVRTLIRDGDLKKAQAELDRLRRVYPASREVAELYEAYRRKAVSSGSGGEKGMGALPLQSQQ
jgi:serine/threonine protein kinase